MQADSAQSVVRLIQITDTHCYADDNSRLVWSPEPVWPNRSLQRVLDHIRTLEGFAALVISGDIVQEETAASYERVGELLVDLAMPVYVLPGNHDVPDLMQTHLCTAPAITKPNAIQLGAWHCIFLDTSRPECSEGHLNENDLKQLAQQLDTVPPDEFVIIFMHHHPVAIGSTWMDGMGLQEKEAFWQLIQAYPQIRAICFGHIHQAHHSEVTYASHTIQVYGTPATCIQLTHNDSTLGLDHTRPAWRTLELSQDGSLHTAVHYLSMTTNEP